MSSVLDLFRLDGRTALVTGGNSGIGRAMAFALASAGAKVMLVARREAELIAARDELRAGGFLAEHLACDLTERAALRTCADRTRARFGAVDILVNAAGVNIRRSFEQVSDDDWDQTLAINLTAPFFLIQRVAPWMQERGFGRIINVASLQSVRAFANSAAYGASKGGIVQLTRATAEAWSRHGITCNAIAPGMFPTALTEPVYADPAKIQATAAQTAIGRNGEMNDLYGITVFLASAASSYMTGHTLFLDGGFTAK